jgi:hypothetical protein
MKKLFIDKNFKQAALDIIDKANEIIEDYAAQGFNLTLRQIYYQFVSKALIPNTERSYKRLGSIINDGRLAGLIDWNAIEDRGRHVMANSHWDTPADVIRSAKYSYKIDMWANQEKRVEVWIEKEALSGVIAPVCRELDVPYFACKGYVSQSEQWRAGQRAWDTNQPTVIVHLGDHDPSGIDMTRDNQSRLSMFSGQNVTVERIALNMDQINQYNPPPNPTKTTDSRATGYIEEFGHSSWELDALEPAVIAQLIRDQVNLHRDALLWIDKEAQLAADLATLDQIVDDLE